MGEAGIIFYDGQCGLCHGFVRFVLARDPAGIFRYAPLQGETAKLHPRIATGDPSAVVVLDHAGGPRLRSEAVVYVLGRIGGAWGTAARALRVVPLPLRDSGYRAIAKLRRAISREPEALCPVVPPELRSRFLP